MMRVALVALLIIFGTLSFSPSTAQPVCVSRNMVAERMTTDGWEVLRYVGQPATNLIDWYNAQEPPTAFIGDEVLFARHDDQPYLMGIFLSSCLVHMDAIPRNAIRWPTRNT